MSHLIKKIGLNPLIKIPKSILRRLNELNELDINTKYVLATLYYFDSINNLSRIKERLPRYTHLSWDECQRALNILAQLRIIDYREGRVFLRVKPIRYKERG